MTHADDGHPISRRTALAAIAGSSVALERLPMIGTADAAAASRGADRIMLIRHGEKPVGAQPPFRITVDGTVDPLSLTAWVGSAPAPSPRCSTLRLGRSGLA